MLPFVLPKLGMTELIVVAFVSLLILGNRLPPVMRSLGESVIEITESLEEKKDDRWFLAIVAATGVGAWVVTRTLIVSAPKLAH